MKNPFLYLSIGLVIFIVGLLSFQVGKQAESLPQDDDNPIISTYKKLSPQAQALYYKQSDKLTKPVPDRLVELDEKNIGCFGPKNVLSMSEGDENLGGQCCGALVNFEAYELQLKAIERFTDENGGGNIIPPDPYDLSVEVAQQLTTFDSEITLTPQQQTTFDEAVAMSHHGGPCCCKCWKWYVMSGLAKKLIVDEGWNADQIAELWDISSSCGHSEDTDMFKHYEHEEHADAPASEPRMIMLHSSNWEFSPSTIVVQEGEDITLHLMGMEGDHGLAVPELGINQTISEGESATVKLPTDKPGTYPFFCFVQCGPGHADMEGVIIIEPRS